MMRRKVRAPLKTQMPATATRMLKAMTTQSLVMVTTIVTLLRWHRMRSCRRRVSPGMSLIRWLKMMISALQRGERLSVAPSRARVVVSADNI